MTRRITFSSGHRYWLRALSEAENRKRFGEWASPFNHGHNYVLEVSVEGLIDSETGMIVNIKTIDEIVRDRVVKVFDGRSINDEIEHFHATPSTTENIASYIRVLLEGAMPDEARLVHLRLRETEDLWTDIDLLGEKMTFTRSYEFAASHRLHVPQFSSEQNLDLFGKCNNEAGHGHNYVLEVTVEGEPDPITGMLVDMLEMDKQVSKLVVDRYDHKHFNVDLPEFSGRVPTSEVVALEIFSRLEGQLPAKLSGIRLYETARNVFEVKAG